MDGSFLEDVESQEGRDPGDIDVVTFVDYPADPIALQTVLLPKASLLIRKHVKATYHVDHFWVALGSAPRSIVDQTRYWTGLFSHRRDGVWKGMVAVELNDPAADRAAQLAMGGKP